ncbi:hypothetical protein HAX54_041743 [Datura stramonium]|uniref:Uncharacterized protein n=1 Tax=Datura stramonium TaxID=4076 RepID=A0ABS8SLA3_DATST|nr:hypothetical protein [Datura stramonium]
MVTRVYLNVEEENFVLRAQMVELSHRFQSNKIINCINSVNSIIDETEVNYEDDFLNPWNLLHLNQPIMASVDASIAVVAVAGHRRGCGAGLVSVWWLVGVIEVA